MTTSTMVWYMLFFTTLCLINVRGQDFPLKDGPCPAIQQQDTNFTAEQFKEIKYVLYTQDVSDTDQSCITLSVNSILANESITLTFAYQQPKGQPGRPTPYKAVPVPDKMGVYQVYIQASDGSWIDENTTYSIMAEMQSDNPRLMSNLIFSCRGVGDKHYQFFQINSSANKISDECYKNFKDIAKKSGNTDDYMTIDQENCTY